MNVSQKALSCRTPFNSGRWSNYILQNERLLDPIQESLCECVLVEGLFLACWRTPEYASGGLLSPTQGSGLGMEAGGGKAGGLREGAACGGHRQPGSPRRAGGGGRTSSPRPVPPAPAKCARRSLNRPAASQCLCGKWK